MATMDKIQGVDGEPGSSLSLPSFRSSAHQLERLFIWLSGMAYRNVSPAYACTALGDARDGDMQLRLDEIYEPMDSPWAVPAYRFDVVADGVKAGTISFRIGDNDRLVRFAGQIGFGIDTPFRGRRLAGRAVRLLLPWLPATSSGPYGWPAIPIISLP